MSPKQISRRRFLRISAAAALCGSGLTGQTWMKGSPAAHAQTHGGMTGMFEPDAEVTLTALEKSVQILPGISTRVMAYEGKLVSGTGVEVVNIPNCYLGPILRMKAGTKLRLNMLNKLPEETVLHPHGLRVPANCDGSPMNPVATGQTSVYEFQVVNPAGPYWFHPHPMDTTPDQVYKGMAGLFYVWDENEERAVPGAASGENDIPVIIQDRVFDIQNQFVYQPNMMWGMLGNRMLVNGTLDASCAVEPRGYRLRLLNGSNARTYKLAWSSGMSLQIIGTDGGLLPAPESREYIMLGPGERADVWADFSDVSGQSVILKSLAFDGGMMVMMGGGNGMMGGMGMNGMNSSGLQSRGMGMMSASGFSSQGMGSAFDILTIHVGKKASRRLVLGDFPPLPVIYDARSVSNFATPTPCVLSMGMMMRWTINGRVYEMTGVAEDEKVVVDEPVAWEFSNLSPIPHPMHIHNTQFQVIERTPSAAAGYDAVSRGFIDSGWKDTVLVWPGEKVKIVMALGPDTGMYMFHCHILEHEDMGMMRNIMVMEKEHA